MLIEAAADIAAANRRPPGYLMDLVGQIRDEVVKWTFYRLWESAQQPGAPPPTEEPEYTPPDDEEERERVRQIVRDNYEWFRTWARRRPRDKTWVREALDRVNQGLSANNPQLRELFRKLTEES